MALLLLLVLLVCGGTRASQDFFGDKKGEFFLQLHYCLFCLIVCTYNALSFMDDVIVMGELSYFADVYKYTRA